jgi:hypothetical protein
MPRNTLALVIVLGMFAILIVGVNIGKIQISKNTQTAVPQKAQTPTKSPTPTPFPLTWNSSECGVSVQYPSNLSKLEAPSGVFFTNTKDAKDTVVIACQKDIPRPALTDDKTEKYSVGSISGTLYHDASEKDGTPIDKLIFRLKKPTTDVYIAGVGPSFTSIVHSLTLYP